MLNYISPQLSAQACIARTEVEVALDAPGWPWSRRVSAWLDCLLVLEEES